MCWLGQQSLGASHPPSPTQPTKQLVGRKLGRAEQWRLGFYEAAGPHCEQILPSPGPGDRDRNVVSGPLRVFCVFSAHVRSGPRANSANDQLSSHVIHLSLRILSLQYLPEGETQGCFWQVSCVRWRSVGTDTRRSVCLKQTQVKGCFAKASV